MTNDGAPTSSGRPPEEADLATLHREHTAELLRQALDDARELMKLEVRLARNEVVEELSNTKASALYLGTGAFFATLGVALALVGVALAIRLGWVPPFVLGCVLLVMGGAMGIGGVIALPKRPLQKTRARLETDLRGLKERAA